MSSIAPTRKRYSLNLNLSPILRRALRQAPRQRGLVIGMILVLALVAFETFNFSTTEFALTDVLGNLAFAGLSWATILALAFCAIDFAGIARLLTPETGRQEPIEIWYLTAAWFLGATMNAMLTWWSVSLALVQHQGLGDQILGRQTLLTAVPIFIAILVWLIRVLLIGSLTNTGERLFSLGTTTKERSRSNSSKRQAIPGTRPASSTAARPSSVPNRRPVPRREPAYAPDPMVAKPHTRR